MKGKLSIKKGKLGWWIEDPNNPDCKYVGPYDTKIEAEEIKKGLTQFYRREDN